MKCQRIINPHTRRAAAPSAHKHSHIVRQTIAQCVSRALGAQTIAILLRRQLRATPCGRELACEYRTAGLPVKSSPSEKGKVLIKRVQ